MTVREQLLQEIAQAPDALLEELLAVCQKARQAQNAPKVQPSETSERGLLDLLDEIDELQQQIPAKEWQTSSGDAAMNQDHYLYGAPKVEG